MKAPTIVRELADGAAVDPAEAAMSLVAALSALGDAKEAIDEAMLTASTSLAGRRDQTPERLADRGGFGATEIVYLGCAEVLDRWEPRDPS